MTNIFKTHFFILFLFTITSSNAQQTVGLFQQDPGSLPGYVLFAPVASFNTYLIDKCGKLVHSWTSTHHPGQAVNLLPDGNLLHTGDANNATFLSGGKGGVLEKFDWDGNLIWSYTISSGTECQHHDAIELPNGNILTIVWELHTVGEAIAEGRNPATITNSLWSDKIVELQPVGSNQANIVWEWHIWDHLVQEFDATKANYGVVADHPELINLNFATGMGANTDWTHCNGVSYNATLNQVMVSAHNFNELWIIDHGTTTAEAASHAGGAHGRGGDLLYRWGNPQAYNRGVAADERFYGQHNTHWIEDGLPDAGKIMVFNNGVNRPGGSYSTVDVLVPPVDAAGNYELIGNNPYGPDSCEWVYHAPVPTDLYSQAISGAQRLSNGNTLIDEGMYGDFTEIDANKNQVWEYINPVGQNGAVSQGTQPFMNSSFRCNLYEPSYSGFAGHMLTPGDPIELNPLVYSCDMFSGIGDVVTAANPLSVTLTNPFDETLTLVCNRDLLNASVVLISMEGKAVMSRSGIDFIKEQAVDLALNGSITSGLYLLNIRTADEHVGVRVVCLR